jgi:hypothetical protein
MPRAPRRSFAILWLLAIHVLANVAVGVYRAQDVNRELTDLFSAALGRSQICLLAMWLALGSDPLSWRLCGFVGGVSFVFVIFTRTALPGQYGAGAGAIWLDEEWSHYFRLSGPGDLLVKAPVLAGLVAAPLIVLRFISRGALAPGSSDSRNPEPDASASRQMSGAKAAPQRRRNRRIQFGLGEASLWIITLSMTFAAIFRTAPYPEWLAELAAKWKEQWRFPNEAAVYAVASGAVYAILALASLWLVYGRTSLWLRFLIFAALVIGPAYACQSWLHRITARPHQLGLSPVWGQASGEVATAAVAALLCVASIILYRLYGPQPHVRPRPVRLRPSPGADRAAPAP